MLLQVKVIAGAKGSSHEYMEDGTLKLRVPQKAVCGKANEAVIKYLSKLFKVPKSKISILQGEKNSRKTLQILNES